MTTAANNATGRAYGRWTRAAAVRRLTLADGGGTFDAQTWAPVKPAEGYAVGVAHGDGANVGPRDDLPWAIEELVRRYSPLYVGTWVKGLAIILDPITIVATLDEAFRLGRITHQEAVYGFAEGRSIPVPS
jgi:hypothetical protein